MHSVRSMVNLPNLGMLGRTGALGDLQKMTARFFKDERMQASMTFQTLYLGLSPYDSLAIYSLLPYVEVAGGIHFPRGGMHQLAVALEKVGRELGVEYCYDCAVTSFEKGASKVDAVRTADGRRHVANIVVTNADLPHAYEAFLGEPVKDIERKRFSCSVVLMYLGLDRQYPHLQHHEFIVGDDMRQGCSDMFDHHRMAKDPPFYVVTTTRTDPSLAPPGGECVFVLVLAPSQPEDKAQWNHEFHKIINQAGGSRRLASVLRLLSRSLPVRYFDMSDRDRRIGDHGRLDAAATPVVGADPGCPSDPASRGQPDHHGDFVDGGYRRDAGWVPRYRPRSLQPGAAQRAGPRSRSPQDTLWQPALILGRHRSAAAQHEPHRPSLSPHRPYHSKMAAPPD
jgi:hypothetical protein